MGRIWEFFIQLKITKSSYGKELPLFQKGFRPGLSDSFPML